MFVDKIPEEKIKWIPKWLLWNKLNINEYVQDIIDNESPEELD